MATIQFFGGVGVIGSSKIVIEQDGWRVLLDFGLEFNPGGGLYRQGIVPRLSHALSDRLRTGDAPWLSHIYDPDLAKGVDELKVGNDHKTAVFITHAHLDHIGLTGYIDPHIPIWASPDTIEIMRAAREAGEAFEGHWPSLRPLEAEKPLNFGPFTVTRYDVDHDIIGASGYSVATNSGLVAFTGDIRLHGRHPEKSLGFAHKVEGCTALVIEGTTLSFGFKDPIRTEYEVDQDFSKILKNTPGLVLLTVYPRNLERIQAFIKIAQAHHRDILWSEPTAAFLQAMGLDVRAFSEELLPDITKNPEHYVLQLIPSDWPLMLDLPLGPGSVFVHANGAPLGTFDPLWPVLQDWLRYVHTSFWSIGTGGHASPDGLRELLEIIHPKVVFPLHSQEPDRLWPPPGTKRWLPERGRIYDLDSI
ncbi:MAG: hypothetical protein C7B47_10615 [Sulfobacillus thermosulfidooxidans]|uniref:Metallo-beta-lactamase domain-containing protein n=1 Tax=Sulfobacillus thermosulfidooxidans TaxID=28034 RepID=A0A2T2WW71_SULTH|nr:MAG: hypothetical protein C7B47_10615 [Sulfobacillus thermosulfidooxidans]